ncbi:hypothetical protein [Mucilaginibacter terrae]|uniref:Uncharacterized protein n=1 Tax=Mucilaginibacter terrae TaxID=1955052 RepID=A0ABU3GUU9_9SPHI|nr:hypothetical protein [Mucilaginibacter terrae]MDT3403548.1 hypothetical protein [Mucilaginibacter terrae]
MKEKRKYVKKEKVVEVTPVSLNQFNKDLAFLVTVPKPVDDKDKEKKQ